MPTSSPPRPPRRRHATAPAARRLLGVTLAMVMLLAACGGEEEQPSSQDPDQPPEQPVTITMNYGTPGHIALYVMQHVPEVAANQGTWYEVDWQQLEASQFARSIASGAVDGGALASLAAANIIEQGGEIVLTGQYVEERAPHTPMTWLVAADSGIDSPADLAGKTIGTLGVGTFADHVANYYISSEGGLEPDQDYQKVDVSFPIMQEALLSGDIVAGPFPPPFLQQTLATGKAEPLFTTLDVQPELVVTVNAFRREFVEEHRVTVEKFMEDWVAANQWMLDPANRQQVLEATSDSTEIPVDVLDRFLLTEEDGYRAPNGALNVEGLQSNWDFFREQGAFTQKLTVEDYVIPELLPPPS